MYEGLAGNVRICSTWVLARHLKPGLKLLKYNKDYCGVCVDEFQIISE